MWTLGTLIVMPLCVILATIFFGLFVYFFHKRKTADRYDRGTFTGFGLGSLAISIAILIATAFGMYPYDADYHKYNIKDGTITRLDTRLVSSGEGMEEKFVVTFSGSDQQYGCLDTRCASLEVGDYLEMACKKVFEYGATDGWDCKFRSWSDQTP